MPENRKQAISLSPYLAAMKTLPSNSVMYEALVQRDSTFEGIFFTCVKTTGIFCRPTCPARKPKFENVEFVSSQQEALFLGYRSCLRCHPMENNSPIPDLVKKLSALIEKDPTLKIKDWNLREMNIDPSTARRQFKKHYGMTFHAYQRARRMGLALHEVREGNTVIATQLNNGYESASGFLDAFKKVFGLPPSQANKMDCLLAKWIETPLGAMLALANSKGLHLLEFVDRRGLENEILWLRKKTKMPILPGTNEILEQITDELEAYYSGKTLTFKTPMIWNGTPFEQSVWRELMTIAPGDKLSYGTIANRIEKATAVRAVGRANGKNCLAIILPCHRVVGADGKLTGYGGGLWRKQWLLEHEEEHK